MSEAAKEKKSHREYEEWLHTFRIRQNDLLRLLDEHHGKNPFEIPLHPNHRARDAIHDACLVAEALMIQKKAEVFG